MGGGDPPSESLPSLQRHPTLRLAPVRNCSCQPDNKEDAVRSKLITAAAALAALAVPLLACGPPRQAPVAATSDAGDPTAGGATPATSGPPTASGRGAAGAGKVGTTVPQLTSPFWQAYNGYLSKVAREEGVDAYPPMNVHGDAAELDTDISMMLDHGVKGLIVTAVDSAAVVSGLDKAASKGVPVVAVDVAPAGGKVAMVVRADSRGHGAKACDAIGARVTSGKVVQIQGDLASANGRERSEAFAACMKQKYPGLHVLDIPADWDSEKAAAGLQRVLDANPDVKAIYLQAGGCYLAPTEQVLKRKNRFFPVGDPRHIVLVSNDGVPQELTEIRNGNLDMTVSQPADAYAKYGLYWIEKAMAGETFTPGPTDHHSTVVEVGPGMLEDQLSAPVITKANVDDSSLWGNNI